jgi:hypothetical protein
LISTVYRPFRPVDLIRVPSAIAAMAGVALFAGCSTTSSPQRGVDYPAPVVTPSPPRTGDAGAPTREWRAAGAGLDAAFERSAFLADSFYRNADALLQQVEKSGAMGVNRGFELAARKGGEWFIEEQRFADTVIGAGVNRNRMDLIDAGLRALEWGYAQQSGDGSFPCRDNFLGGSYFVAATAHSLWLLETTGYARSYTARINALRPKLERAAHWLADNSHPAAVLAQQDAYSSRHFLTGYALAASGRYLGDSTLALVGEDTIQKGLKRQHTTGYFQERGGYDASFQAEALVYLLRYYDHAATAEMQRAVEPALRLALGWLESRVSPRGVITITGNTRTGAAQERDRTGAPRRVSAVAVSRAFGLARHVLGDSKFETLARAVATARQPG